MTWKELRDFLEAEGIKDSDQIASLKIHEGLDEEIEQAEAYFDHDKNGNRRLYLNFKSKTIDEQ